MAARSGIFLETIVALLMPYFMRPGRDVQDVRTEICATLAAYAVRTHAEILEAAQIIAFSMTSLDVLAEARTTEMSASMRVRCRGCANGLRRATAQLEKALNERLAAGAAEHADSTSEPLDDAPGSGAEAAIQARAELGAHRDRPPSTRPVVAPILLAGRDRSNQLHVTAMMDEPKQMGIEGQRIPASPPAR